MGLRDPVSSASHLLTAVWAAYVTLFMLRLTWERRDRRAAVAVFGTSMVLLYLASGLFHAVPYTRAEHPAEFRFFQRLDQSAILLLIAGTNTPIQAVLLAGRRRRVYLGIMWGLAAAGIVCLWLLPKPPYGVIVGLYLAMGWFGGVPLLHYARAVGWRAMNWVWLGGVAYSVGAACEVAEWPQVLDWPVRVGSHEVFHFCDIVGTLAFFFFVLRHVIPYQTAEAEGGHLMAA